MSAPITHAISPQHNVAGDPPYSPPPYAAGARPASLSDNDPPAPSSSCGSAAPMEWNATAAAAKHSAVSTAKLRAPLMMHVRTQTWLADSHGLFDYESRSVIANEFKCSCQRKKAIQHHCYYSGDSYHVCRVGPEIRFLSEDEASELYTKDNEAKPLLKVAWANGNAQITYDYFLGCYNLVPPTSEDHQTREDRLWLVVRHLQDRSVVVTQGDVLKLGRFKLRVKETVVSPSDIKTSLRFLCHDDDDCETVAPEPGDSAVEFDGIFETSEQIIPPVQQPQVVEAEISTQKYSLHTTSTNCPRICRICLCEADEGDDVGYNPLVAPCECKGSMRWVHLQCLRTWMSGRLNIRNVRKIIMCRLNYQDGNMVSFFWRTLECELCRLAYPSVVRVRDSGCVTDDEQPEELEEHGTAHDEEQLTTAETRKRSSAAAGWKTLELFEIPRLDIPYAVLEPRSQQNRGLHIVSLANNKSARLGRGHESDIRLADISVSRLHSILRFQSPPLSSKRVAATSIVGSGGIGLTANDVSNGYFIIEDNRSKFGTLLELRKPFRLEPNSTAISVQAGRTVVTVSLRKRWRFRVPACISMSKNSSDIYVVLRQQQAVTQANDVHDISPGVPHEVAGSRHQSD